MKMVRYIKDRWTHSCALAGATLALAPAPAWAQAVNTNDVETMVDLVLALLTGPIAKGLAAIALVIAGIMFFFGAGNKGLLGSIIIGCFIVFGAGWIVDTVSGT
ncbi:type IV secretion system protein VirB2 [Sphingobium sp. AP50]|uniref:TrbC/VirB2 family protein n=1 Tax=Sphingobium sp. AP50 TaxID=1884369 RepID=UPI0008AB5731|nr:TrbC/VirB2 family protein [Sphingobium sp. AP50]SEK03771.1 type IV secretion system protein VirB2 [Sphingobium sp. AP50]